MVASLQRRRACKAEKVQEEKCQEELLRQEE